MKDQPTTISDRAAKVKPLKPEMADVIGHTPGPWLITENGANGYITIQGSNRSVVIQYDLGCIPDERSYEPIAEELYANARLIAAAPELLALIEEINCWLTCPDLSKSVVSAYKHDCELAMAKAKGQP